MTGKNWNSKKGIYENIQNEETKKKARIAIEMREKGHSVSDIAEKMKLSKNRIYEYLRK